MNEADPSVLRFLIASREEVSSRQLRDDLLSMLVAGHETTGSVLTWTLYLLEQNPRAMAKVKIHCIPVKIHKLLVGALLLCTSHIIYRLRGPPGI